MVLVYHPKPLVINQEITNYAVAASKLSNPLCSIIDESSKKAKGKRKKIKNTGHRGVSHPFRERQDTEKIRNKTKEKGFVLDYFLSKYD